MKIKEIKPLGWRYSALLVVSMVVIAAAFMLSSSAKAQEGSFTKADGTFSNSAERGWFWQYWYEMQKEEELKRQQEREELAEEAPEKLEVEPPCESPETWEPSCGFVEPATDYEWSQQQRVALMQAAVMEPNNPEKVRAYQEMVAWAVDKAMTMTNMWEWNMAQHQDLNPYMTRPAAAFALRALASAKTNEQIDIMTQIREQGGFLMWFSRKECEACGIQAPAVQGLGRWADLPVYEASLSGGCHAGFEGEFCQQGERIQEAAKTLNVAYVPDVWLYLKNEDAWIRVSSGMEAQSTIMERMKMFFTGVVQAAAKGIVAAKDQHAPIDFDFSPQTMSKGMLSEGVRND